MIIIFNFINLKFNKHLLKKKGISLKWFNLQLFNLSYYECIGINYLTIGATATLFPIQHQKHKHYTQSILQCIYFKY